MMKQYIFLFSLLAFVYGDGTGPYYEGTGSTSLPCSSIGDLNYWYNIAVHKDIVIVGAGISGLSAAWKLQTLGFTDVVVLEAQDYIGGRVKTYKQGGIIVEEGAEWIHGNFNNPLTQIAYDINQLSPLRRDSEWEWSMVQPDGNPPPRPFLTRYEQMETIETNVWGGNTLFSGGTSSLGQAFEDEFRRRYGSGHDGRIGRAWLNYLHQRTNVEEGTGDWKDISGIDAGNYREIGDEEGGDKYQWKNGYNTLINYYKDGIAAEIMTNSPVCKVKYNLPKDGGSVLVILNDGRSYLANKIIVTSSLGVLKENYQHMFEPKLDQSFINTLGYMKFGTVNKIQLGWDQKWWTKPALSLEILWTTSLQGDEKWMENIMEFFSVRGSAPVLQLFVGSAGSAVMENLSENTVRNQIMSLLRRTYRMNIPEPSFFRRSQWRSNPWTRGSYNSFVTPAGANAGILDRSSLRVPMAHNSINVLYFAGEHTSDDRYGTVDGALVSGERVANEVANDSNSGK